MGVGGGESVTFGYMRLPCESVARVGVGGGGVGGGGVGGGGVGGGVSWLAYMCLCPVSL